jgi:hypothetical protein
MLMRYAALLALAAGSLYAVVTLSETTGQQMLVDAGVGRANPNSTALWVLGAIAVLIGLSLFRFVVFGIPILFRDWYHEHRELIYTLILSAVVCGIFYLK